jgi:chromosomal replication initiator protein
MTEDATTFTPENRETLREEWTRIQSRLKQELGDTIWKSWVKPLKLMKVEGGVVFLTTESKLTKTRVMSQFADRIRANCGVEWNAITSIHVDVMRHQAAIPSHPIRATEQSTSQPNQSRMMDMARAKDDIVSSGAPIDAYDDWGGRLDPRLTFSNFVVGGPNNFAYAAAKRMAETESPVFNPLFLYGGVGLGKTHLMHAIGWEMRERFPKRRVVYLSAEVFMHRFIKALRHRNTTQFKEEFRSIDVLMIDDVQFIGGKDSTQEEFFHTFNALIDQNKKIIISADKSPMDLSGMEERLRSRLNWGMVADIHPTTFELRVGILQAKAEQQGLDLPQNVIEFLAHKITTNVRELEGALNRLSAYSTLINAPITIDSIYDVLGDVLRASTRQVSIAEIQREVAKHYNIRLDEMHSRRRSRNIVHPRQVAMYLAKNLTSNSYPEIGQYFGGRDHTTVMHAVGKIEKMLIEDQRISDDLKILKSLLNAG